MTTNVNIAVIFITLFFHSTTLATDDDLWFPKEFSEQNLVKCGLDHEMYGLSLINDYMFQFEKCSVIIYPNKHFDENINQINFDNGYRFTFEKIQPNWQSNYCSIAKSIQNPKYSLLRLKLPNNEHDNHVLLYLIGMINSNNSFLYYVYDFNTNIDSRTNQKINKDNIRFLLLTNNEEQFVMHNALFDDKYQLIGDPITGKAFDMDYICISQTIDNNPISKKPSEQCEELDRKFTDSLLKTIDLTFSVNEKLLLISKQDNKVLITDIALLEQKNSEKQFPLQIKSIQDVFVCSKTKQHDTDDKHHDQHENDQHHHQSTENQNENQTKEFKLNGIIFISSSIIIIIILILIVYTFTTTRNRAKKSYNVKRLISFKRDKYDKTIRSELEITNTNTTT